MSIKTQEYLKAAITILIIILLVFILDLPKDIFVTLGVITPFAFLMYALFPPKEKDLTRKRVYITSVSFFIIFATLIFIFILLNNLFIFIGFLAIFFIFLDYLLLYKLLNTYITIYSSRC